MYAEGGAMKFDYRILGYILFWSGIILLFPYIIENAVRLFGEVFYGWEYYDKIIPSIPSVPLFDCLIGLYLLRWKGEQ